MGNAQDIGHSFEGKSGEDMQFDEFGGPRVVDRQLVDHIVNREYVRILNACDEIVGERHSYQLAPTFCRGSPAGGFHEDATHRLGGGGEEVPAAVELLVADQTEICLMHEGGAIEGMAGGFCRHASRCQSPQLVINEREKISSGLPVTGRDRIEKAGHVGHEGQVYRPWAARSD